MASTTYEHFVDTNKMYAIQRRFRDFTKTFCDFVKVNKIDHLGNVTEMYAAQEQFRHVTKMVCARLRGLTKTCHLGNANKMVTFCHRFTVLGNMVRNAGELPQPFWLGSARGGGSCGAACCAART